MARRQGFFDDLVSMGLNIAVEGAASRGDDVIAIATQAPATANTLAGLGSVVQDKLFHVLAEFLQYIIPAGLLIGATVGFFRERQSGAYPD